MAANPGTVDPLSIRHGRDRLAAMRTRLHELVQDQASLWETRKGLLGERAKLAATVKDVRNRRRTTANAEVLFLDRLREFYRMQGSNLPQTIAEAYDKVMEERDALGIIEDEFLAAEHALGGHEWALMDKERALYQYSLQEILLEPEDTVLYNVQPINQSLPPQPPRPPAPPSRLIPKNEVILRNPPPPPPPASFLQYNIIIRNPPPPPPPASLLQDNVIIRHPPPPSPPPLPPPPPPPLLQKFTRIVQNAPPPPRPTPPSASPKNTTVKLTPPSSPGAHGTQHLSHHQQLRVARSEHDTLGKRLEAARRQRFRAEFPQDYSSGDTAWNLTSNSDSRETCDELLPNNMKGKATSALRQRRASEPIETDRRPSSLFESSIPAQTDEMLASVTISPDYKSRIRDRLLDYFRINAVDKIMCSNVLAVVGVVFSAVDFSGVQLRQPSKPIHPSTGSEEIDPISVSSQFSSFPVAEPATDDLVELQNLTQLTGNKQQDRMNQETPKLSENDPSPFARLSQQHSIRVVPHNQNLPLGLAIHQSQPSES